MADEPKDTAGPQEPAAAPRIVKKNPVEDVIRAAFGDDITIIYNIQDELEIRVPSARLIELCGLIIKNTAAPYDYLRNLTAVDWKDRIEMVYNVCATSTMENIVIKCDLNSEAPWVDTVTHLWSSADWLEREVFDLFGVGFGGHPDLRRIMLPEEWEGHPLRKDYKMPED